MKKLILSAIMLGLAFASHAQITISNTSFPKLGDRVIMHHDTTLSSAIGTGSAGANQTWNFAGLVDGFQDTTTAVNVASTGMSASYPTATLGMDQGGGNYGYVKVGTSTVDLLGYSGVFVGTTPTAVKMNPAQIMAKAGMTFGSAYTNTSSFRISFSGADVGQTTFDSVRINFTQRIYNNFDGWGTLTSPNGTYNCLRNNQLNVSTQVFDVKVPFLGWMNGAQADSSATTSYLFLDNASAMEVVGVDVDSFGVITDARYRELGSVLGVESVKAANQTALSIFPLPVNNASVAIVSGLNAGNYTASIVNVAGQQVYTQSMQANNNGMLMMNIGQLSLMNGYYIASVHNAAGEVVASRKFQVTK